MNLKQAWAFIDKEEAFMLQYLQERGWESVEFGDMEWTTDELVHRFVKRYHHWTESMRIDIDYHLNWKYINGKDESVISEGQGMKSLKKLQGEDWQKEIK